MFMMKSIKAKFLLLFVFAKAGDLQKFFEARGIDQDVALKKFKR